MRIIIAPDSYKGSLSAVEVAEAMARGIVSVFPDAEIVSLPVADGGEGTVEALVAATSGRFVCQEVSGPLGEPVMARWGILGDGATAVIEMAAASGLPLVAPERRNPLRASTCGTGELIRAALDAGLRRLIVGIGGSATNDGGAGMARALGVRFLDADGTELPEGGAALARLARVDLDGLDPRLVETSLQVACDVTNPLCGENGASVIYGPQKGATPEMVRELDRALEHYSQVVEQAIARNVSDQAGSGAAGGLGAGLRYFTNASLLPGVKIVLDAVGFAEALKTADLVITGEGCSDAQTAHGKAPLGVARLARNGGVPVICLSGGLGAGAEQLLEHGIDALLGIVSCPMPLEDCMARAAELVETATSRVCRLLRVGRGLGGRR
ncbi:glycerate kinase [Pelobacter propionicus]|uniref:Glycerate kinase n=1 Tax=Pelobacter propionicus (strain DSM 2379 / NBRC 103807 / OttBd1) TaxID=338966 RepID=A1AT42_PELPD|nr:glycerate kinase [Pelobacter propionicus]ABL00513.1 Glycerate kinase [Pelobacter propionicus DSM 2379]